MVKLLNGYFFMEKKYLTFNDVNAYKISFGLSNYVWAIIIKWNYFEKDTVGKQFARVRFGEYSRRLWTAREKR
jgi:hypothetical protein